MESRYFPSEWRLPSSPLEMTLFENGKARRSGPSRGASRRLTLRQRLDLPALGAGEQRARAADLVFGVADHLVELGDPADRAGEGEDSREQGHRDADRALHD